MKAKKNDTIITDGFQRWVGEGCPVTAIDPSCKEDRIISEIDRLYDLLDSQVHPPAVAVEIARLVDAGELGRTLRRIAVERLKNAA